VPDCSLADGKEAESFLVKNPGRPRVLFERNLPFVFWGSAFSTGAFDLASTHAVEDRSPDSDPEKQEAG